MRDDPPDAPATDESWQDLISAALAALVSALCLAASIYRVMRDDDLAAAMLGLLSIGVGLFGFTLAMRKLRGRR